VNDRVAMHTKQAPYMTYVVGIKAPRGYLPRGLYWDMEDPYHYVRLQSLPDDPESELVIIGGEDHKTGQADDVLERHGRLEAWARERFPKLGETAYRWGGQVMETIDGLAFIGRNPLDHDNVYIVTGDSGMGLTHGTIAGMLLTDLIMGRENPWASLYDPARKPVGAALEFVKENVNVAAQYGAWLTGGEIASSDEIANDCGAVMRHGLTKVAVYRDKRGHVHTLSAVCPHLGCLVGWNAAEKTWDCPCHGSRFDRLGKAINGPANGDLKPVEVEEHAS
jgi:nitrite reductase/ring-hydroxylating ferredoxin subunit